MNKTTKTILGFVIVIILAFLVWYGVSKKPQTPVSKESIKIGASLPLTGEAASFGQSALAGITLAIEEINNVGGIEGRKVEFVAEDDNCNSTGGINAMNKLVNIDKPTVILGSICSAAAGPALPLAQKAGIPTVIVGASAPHLTKVGDYIFRVYPSDAFQGKFAAEFIYNKLKKQKVAVVYVKNDWGEGIQEVFSKRFEELGGQIVYKGSILQTDTDLKTEISKVKNSGADVLYFPVYPNNAIAGLKQMKEMSFNIPIVGGDAFDAEEVISSGYTDGVIYTVAKINMPEDFKTRIKGLAGFSDLKITIGAPLGYDAAKIALSAIANSIKKGKLDGLTIKEELKNTSYKGVSSPLIEFDENGDLKTPVFEVKVIKDKKSVPYSD